MLLRGILSFVRFRGLPFPTPRPGLPLLRCGGRPNITTTIQYIFVSPKLFLSLAALVAFSSFTRAQTASPISASLDEPILLTKIVVTAGPVDRPLETTLDARAPVQPIPTQDGADFLKCVPGFCVIRKGGADGDPVLRGQAGSRLNVLLDGEAILGGCGNRMDPPTAYVFPAAYDRVTILKGPQTVLYGPGGSAGVVLFERDDKRLSQPGAGADGSLTAGSFGRLDEALEIHGGTPDVFMRVTGTHSQQEDYEDGAGREVHGRYRRWSGNLAIGWTPAERTALVLSAARSDGEAAYADRMMDGTRFDRENVGLSFKQEALPGVVSKIEGRVYYNYVDHVMDSFTLRSFTSSTMMPNPSVSNPDRRTVGGRVAVELAPTEDLGVTLGFDAQQNRHTVRSSSNQLTDPYETYMRLRDARFENYGIFSEVRHKLAERWRLIGGLRADRWQVADDRAMIKTGMTATANPTQGQERRSLLGGGFVRVEKEAAALPLTVFAGLGHTERFPDYWELFSKESSTTVSAFGVQPEETTQVDTGLIYKKGALTGSLTVFANRVSNYILIQSGYLKPAGMMGTRASTLSRNVDASSWGGEAALAYRIAKYWRLDGSLAYVEGRNRTDHLPLAQQPPLEGRLGLSYATEIWSLGVLSRIVAAQNRFALNQGNIVGQDLGPVGGFSVFSLNGGWRIARYAQIAAGVDNVFDRTYAEFISRSGSGVAGFTTTSRVNEPGRTFWAKLDLKY